MTTYGGIVLKGDEDEACAVAFITDESVTTHSTEDDDEIMDLIEEYRPKIVALNAPQEVTADKGFREEEEDLIDDGYSMLPRDMRNRRLLERAEFISNTIKRSGVGTRIIESNPDLIAQKLDVTGDKYLEAYGIDTSDIDNVWEFDALLLALTAKLHDEDRSEGDDIVLPEDIE